MFTQNPWILDFSDVVLNSTVFSIFLAKNSSALLGPSLDKFEKIRIKVGLVLVAICDKTEYTN